MECDFDQSAMKTTIDIPDELYRRVKARSALLGKRIRDVTIELYSRWLEEEEGLTYTERPQQWLHDWVRIGEENLRDSSPRPTATEILEEDRSRRDHL